MRSRKQRPPLHPLKYSRSEANFTVKLPPLYQPAKLARSHWTPLEYSLRRINLLDSNFITTVVPLHRDRPEYSVFKQKAKWLVQKNRYSRDQFVLRKTCLSADNAAKMSQMDTFCAEKQRVNDRDVGPWEN